MVERVSDRVREITSYLSGSPVALEFAKRCNEGHLSRDENPYTHFCVYFAGYDPKEHQVFIGHHKKSGLWLFNGGHMDKGETPEESLYREMGEEWGLKVELERIEQPKLLTITPISNPLKQKCTSHYDIWYFVPLSVTDFQPDPVLLETEFYQTGWKTIDEAKKLVIDANTLKAITEFHTLFSK